MPREPIPTWFYVLIVVRSGHHFLLVQEASHGQHWFVPGGRVEQGEVLAEAAVRETLEESGVPVQLDGLLRIEHTPSLHGTRVRVIYLAHPVDDTPPKSEPDEHTLRAGWVRLGDLSRLPLREPSVIGMLAYVANGGAIYPLDLIAPEGMGFVL